MRAFIIIRNYNNSVIISVVKHTGEDKDNFTRYICRCAQHFPINNTLCLTNSKTVYCLVFFSCHFLVRLLFYFFYFFILLFQLLWVVVLFCLVGFFFFPPFSPTFFEGVGGWGRSGLGGWRGLVVCFVFSTSVECRPMTPLLFLPFLSYCLACILFCLFVLYLLVCFFLLLFLLSFSFSFSFGLFFFLGVSLLFFPRDILDVFVCFL